MEVELSLGIGGALLVLGLLSAWRGARPPNPHKGPRLMPWRFIMLLSAAGALLSLGHAAHLIVGR